MAQRWTLPLDGEPPEQALAAMHRTLTERGWRVVTDEDGPVVIARKPWWRQSAPMGLPLVTRLELRIEGDGLSAHASGLGIMVEFALLGVIGGAALGRHYGLRFGLLNGVLIALCGFLAGVLIPKQAGRPWLEALLAEALACGAGSATVEP